MKIKANGNQFGRRTVPQIELGFGCRVPHIEETYSDNSIFPSKETAHTFIKEAGGTTPVRILT